MREIYFVPDKRELPARLKEIARKGDMVITLGAGDIYIAGEGLLETLNGEG